MGEVKISSHGHQLRRKKAAGPRDRRERGQLGEDAGVNDVTCADGSRQIVGGLGFQGSFWGFSTVIPGVLFGRDLIETRLS